MTTLPTPIENSRRARPEWDRLLSCAQKNNANEIQRLIAQGVSPSHSNAINQSALHIACLWGNIAATQVLLTHSADVKAQNRITGASPLHSCVQSSKTPAMNRVKCAELLIEAGADVHLKDLYGMTPLDTLETEIERNGIQPNDEYVNAMREVLGETQNQKDLVLIPLLESEDLSLESLSKCLKSREGNLDVDERHPRTGKTALHIATDRIVELLEEADIQIKEKEFLDLSAIIKLLLSNGSDPNATPEIKSPTQTTSITVNPMHVICMALYAELSNQNDDLERSRAYQSKCLEDICLTMLSNRATLKPPTINLMHDAARRGYTNAVQFWVEKLGIDPNTKGRQGLTPLHFAARSGRIDVVKYLLTMSVDISILDERGKTALDAAQVNENTEIVELLTSWT